LEVLAEYFPRNIELRKRFIWSSLEKIGLVSFFNIGEFWIKFFKQLRSQIHTWYKMNSYFLKNIITREP